jgi:hypothetical protein
MEEAFWRPVVYLCRGVWEPGDLCVLLGTEISDTLLQIRLQYGEVRFSWQVIGR